MSWITTLGLSTASRRVTAACPTHMLPPTPTAAASSTSLPESVGLDAAGHGCVRDFCSLQTALHPLPSPPLLGARWCLLRRPPSLPRPPF